MCIRPPWSRNMLFRISFQNSTPVLRFVHDSFPTISFPDISKQRIGTERVEAFIIPCSGRQRWLLKTKYVSARVHSLWSPVEKKRAYPSSSCRSIAHSGRKPWWIVVGEGVCCRGRWKKSHLNSHTQWFALPCGFRLVCDANSTLGLAWHET